MKIQELHNKYRGRVAYLFGSGPSHKKFYVSKQGVEVWFGINYTFETIKELDFLFVQDYETYLDITPKARIPLIIPYKMVRRLQTERTNVFDIYSYQYELQDPMKNQPSDIPNKDYGLHKDVKIFSYTATSQCAIHILAYMGFKDIFLVGFDYKEYENGKMHAETSNKEYSEQGSGVLARLKQGDDFIIDQLKHRYDISIINLSDGI